MRGMLASKLHGVLYGRQKTGQESAYNIKYGALSFFPLVTWKVPKRRMA